MSFHKRNISNNLIFILFEKNGVDKIFDIYTKGVDSVITESGLSSDISNIINIGELKNLTTDKIKKQIKERILISLHLHNK